jgi:hypothetical protein
MPKALGLGAALMLVVTVASANDERVPPPDAFRVSWQQETDPVAGRIEGRVHNDSLFRVTDVRLEVQGLDDAGRIAGRAFVWAIGDIEPRGETSFVFESMAHAVGYRIAVVSYDVVSAPAAPESR